MGASTGPSSIDLGTGGGRWMFKDGGMVFGPIPARMLIEKLYRGEIGPETEVALEDHEDFRSLREIDFFTVHLAKAQAKLRVERDESRRAEQARRRRYIRAAGAGAVLLAALAVAGGGAFWAVKTRQRRLADEVTEIPITPNPPALATAETRPHEDDVAIPTAAGTTRREEHGPAPAGGSPDIVAARYDKGSIIGAEARQKGELIPCIRDELRRTPDFRGDIRFSLAVGNDGHVAKLWMEDARFKDGPLEACFRQAMDRWRFPLYEGERATVSDSFHVGR